MPVSSGTKLQVFVWLYVTVQKRALARLCFLYASQAQKLGSKD
jgi:hypothetical protein